MAHDDLETTLKMRWWEQGGDTLAHKDQLAHDLIRVYQHLEEVDKYRLSLNLHHLRLYGNQAVRGVNPSSYDKMTISGDRVTLNVIANVCDLATARIGKGRPAAKVLPQGGNHTLSRKARLLQRFLSAQFRISKIYDTTRKVFKDACVFGTGCLKISSEGKEIFAERIFPGELFVDPLEGLYGEPRMIIQRKWVSRQVLEELYAPQGGQKDKKERARIRAVLEESKNDVGERDLDARLEEDSVSDLVLVLEAWHLPSGKDAKDGKHAIVVQGGHLVVEEYKHDALPFLFIRWKDRLRGFWGVGLAEELTGIQIEINRLLQKIQVAHQRLGNALVFIDARSNLDKNAMTNEIGSFVSYMGKEPKVATFQTVHPEIYAHLDRLYARAFDIAGMSQDSVAPSQSSISGVSAETQHEIGSERFVIQGQEYERLHLDISKELIRHGKLIGTKHKDFSLPAVDDRNTISSVEWKDVDMEEDEYVLSCLPVSSLPLLPGARQKRVLELLQFGVIDPQEAAEMMDMPDLERHLDLAMAARRDIERSIENMLDEGIYEPPEPYTDLRLALKMCQAAYNKAKNDGVEEERLDLLRTYLTEAHRLMQRAQAEQMKLAAANAAQGEPVGPGPGAPPATGPDGQPPMAATPSAPSPF